MGDEASDFGSAVALGPDDAGEVLTLQRAAYVSEAQAHDDLWLPGKLDRHIEMMVADPTLLYTTSLVQHFLEPGCEPPPGFRRESSLVRLVDPGCCFGHEKTLQVRLSADFPVSD